MHKRMGRKRHMYGKGIDLHKYVNIDRLTMSSSCVRRICMHVRVRMYVYVHTHTHTHSCIGLPYRATLCNVYVCMYICMWAYRIKQHRGRTLDPDCMYVLFNVCMYVCVYV